MTHPELSLSALNKLTAKTIESTLMNAFEMPIIWHRDNQWIQKKVTAIHNEKLLIEAVNKKKGVIVLCPHVGNWEVFGRLLPGFAPTTSLYSPPKQQVFENTIRKGRELSGAKLVPTDAKGIKQLFKALRSGEITGILPDQVPKAGSGVFAPFFGVHALTMTLIHRLIQKTGCEAIIGYAIRNKEGFEIHFKAVNEYLFSDDVIESACGLNKSVEMSLEEDVSQYQWGYKRFKAQPDNQDPY